jgi:hypothetical protein
MDLGIVMRGEVLQDRRADGRAGRAVATWNTRRLPTRVTPGWTNRLFVACAGWWRGYFLLSWDVLWNPKDETAPYALTSIRGTGRQSRPCRRHAFAAGRYLDSPPGAEATSSHTARLDDRGRQQTRP